MIDIGLLARPIEVLLKQFGITLPHGPQVEQSVLVALDTANRVLATAQVLAPLAADLLHNVWEGPAADIASKRTSELHRSLTEFTKNSSQLKAVTAEAVEIITRRSSELSLVLTSFISKASAALPALSTPVGQLALLAVAAEHLSKALTIVAETLKELEAPATRLDAMSNNPVRVPPTTSTTSQSQRRKALPSPQQRANTDPTYSGNNVQSTGHSFGQWPTGAHSSLSSSVASLYTGSHVSTADGFNRTPPAGTVRGDDGVRIQLPDGSVSIAPNETAARAVRAALTQQGVPYSWGGTTPGVALDCSGLTQWAYGEAGIALGRTSWQQNTGVQVPLSDIQPGDLLLWKGHVAMAIGNGQLIEAGDPVSVGPIRTNNAGMAFQGVFRPTSSISI